MAVEMGSGKIDLANMREQDLSTVMAYKMSFAQSGYLLTGRQFMDMSGANWEGLEGVQTIEVAYSLLAKVTGKQFCECPPTYSGKMIVMPYGALPLMDDVALVNMIIVKDANDFARAVEMKDAKISDTSILKAGVGVRALVDFDTWVAEALDIGINLGTGKNFERTYKLARTKLFRDVTIATMPIFPKPQRMMFDPVTRHFISYSIFDLPANPDYTENELKADNDRTEDYEASTETKTSGAGAESEATGEIPKDAETTGKAETGASGNTEAGFMIPGTTNVPMGAETGATGNNAGFVPNASSFPAMTDKGVERIDFASNIPSGGQWTETSTAEGGEGFVGLAATISKDQQK